MFVFGLALRAIVGGVLVMLCAILSDVFSFVVITGEGSGGLEPLESNKNIRFLSNTCKDLLKKKQKPSHDSLLDHHRPASENAILMPIRWRADVGPL